MEIGQGRSKDFPTLLADPHRRGGDGPFLPVRRGVGGGCGNDHPLTERAVTPCATTDSFPYFPALARAAISSRACFMTASIVTGLPPAFLLSSAATMNAT